MSEKANKQVIAKLRRELIASDKREEQERQIQDKLRADLASVIARTRGLEIGKSYYVLPTPGRKFRAEIIKFDRHWSESKDAKHISVLVKYYNRNGAFKTEWLTTENNEFTPISEATNGE